MGECWRMGRGRARERVLESLGERQYGRALERECWRAWERESVGETESVGERECWRERVGERACERERGRVWESESVSMGEREPGRTRVCEGGARVFESK